MCPNPSLPPEIAYEEDAVFVGYCVALLEKEGHLQWSDCVLQAVSQLADGLIHYYLVW